MENYRSCYTISVLQQKGGAGKTTIATNLAYYFSIANYNTLLVDSDPNQRSARDWHAANDGQLVTCIGLDTETLPKDLKSISEPFDIVIIDGTPQIAKLSVAAILASDLILIPVQPSPYDVWATADLVELIKTRRAINNENPQAAFILSRVIKNTLLSKEVTEALQEYSFPILDSVTTQRVDYATSASSGNSVLHKPNSQAAFEINRLGAEILVKYIES